MTEIKSPSTASRYLQLAVIVLGSGAIYPLIYLRQNFEVSLLQSFGISLAELGQCYSLLGIIFTLTYFPSGWLADRVSPRILISFSLLGTAILGVWFSTIPNLDSLRLIFVGWGITTGLTFWAAMIKSVALLARSNEQGRFFGILDGGRGLVEAIFATIAVALFAYHLNDAQTNVTTSLQYVIYMYIGVLLLAAPLVFFLLTDENAENGAESAQHGNLLQDLKVVLSNTRLWFCAFCILCGYQLFWATYSFSAYMQDGLGMTAVTAGTITVAKLWMRPIGGVCAGFVGDRFNCAKVLKWLMLMASASLLMLVFSPFNHIVMTAVTLVLIVGVMTYAVRGIYWSTLDSCGLPSQIKGLAIGIVSLVAFMPDIYSPMLNAQLLEMYPGRLGYERYFLIIAGFGIVGAMAAAQLQKSQK